MYLEKNGHRFSFTDQVRKSPDLRESFFSLARQVFSLDFAPWYQGGGWGDRYIPHALVLGRQVAANVSVNTIDFLLNGVRRTYVQLGTVMTHPDFRGMGLSRFLLETVLDAWRDRCDCLYLFANDTVLDFYPRFGFVPAKEAQPVFPIVPGQPLPRRRLCPDLPEDRALLFKTYRQSNPFSAFSMDGNEGLFLFYVLGPFRDMLYELPGQSAVAILEEDGEVLYCHELLGRPKIGLLPLLEGLAGPGIRQIRLGFTPRPGLLPLRFLPGEEHLFVLAGKENPFAAKSLFFPQISHA